MDARRPGREAAAAAGAIAAGALIVALALLAWRWMTANGIDPTALTSADVEAFTRAWGPWGAVGSVVLMVLHSFVPLPAEIIAVSNGMMFGAGLGIALTWLGAMLGAVLSFALARRLGRPALRRLLPEAQWRRIDTLPMRPSALLLVRLVPVISFNLVNYAAGVLGVGWWPFLWTTALGILPLTVLMVLLGKELMAAPWWAWALAAAAFLGGWIAIRRYRRRASRR